MTKNTFFEVCWWIGLVALFVVSYCYGVIYNTIAYVND